MRRAKLLVAPCLLWVAACGATPLAPKFAPPATPTEAVVAENIVRAAPRSERAVAVGLSAEGATLCAWELNGGLLWELPVQAKSAPLVVGDAVVMQEAAGVVVRDLASGQVRVTLDDGGELVGADGVGSALAISIAFKEEGGPRGTLVFVTGDTVRWDKALNQPVGTPALVENQVLVPWGTQRLSVFSAEDGSELSRWNFRNLMLGQALVDRGRVYVGQMGWLRVEKDLPAHQEGPLTLLSPLKRSLPGQPSILRDGYASVAEPDSASHRVKLEWRPGVSATIEDNQALFRFYRYAFGMAAQTDEVRWVRVFEHDLIGAATQPGGTFLADTEGSLRFVDARGVTTFKQELKKRLRVVTLRPGAFVPPSSAAALEAPLGSLHDQLLAAARVDDDQLYPARALAVQHMAHGKDTGVTRVLIDMCSNAGNGRNAVQLSACDELGKREGDPHQILEALRLKASFLEGTAAPPVAALAQAAARTQLVQAAPLLLSHAEDPHTGAADLVSLFQALAALEYAPAATQIERFVRLHHAEPAGSDLSPALQAALDVLGKLRAKQSRSTLQNVANDPLTLEPVRQKAKEALLVLDTPPVKREEPKAVAAKTPQPPPEPVTDPRPYALDSSAVQKAFRPIHTALVGCLDAGPDKPRSARIAMIVAGDGHMEGFFVTPTSLQGCMDAILRNTRFPATRLSRQHVTHSVYADVASAKEPTAVAAPGAVPAQAAAAAPRPTATPKKKPAAAKAPGAAGKP